jgi:carbamoyltransferase
VDRAYDVLKQEIRFDPETLKIRTRIHGHIMVKKLKKKLAPFRFDHIAGATQRLTEELLCAAVRAAIKKTGIRDVVAAGGTFMNIKGNHDIAGMPEVEHFYVTPSCGDDSLAIGACYSAWLEHEGQGLPAPLDTLYLGDEPDTTDIEKKAEARGFRITKCDNINKTAAELLSKGVIIARCSGRMEFGARALGNRSILANPAFPDVVERINRAIKHRDFWMPFAPVIMAEQADRYIADYEVFKKTQADYMMVGFESTPLAKEHLRGALHAYDKTMRPQILTREKNPDYYNIIEEFAAITGQHALLNTSFNIHGKPIVRSTEDALEVLEQSGLTHLVIGDYLIEKPDAE